MLMSLRSFSSIAWCEKSMEIVLQHGKSHMGFATSSKEIETVVCITQDI